MEKPDTILGTQHAILGLLLEQQLEDAEIMESMLFLVKETFQGLSESMCKMRHKREKLKQDIDELKYLWSPPVLSSE